MKSLTEEIVYWSTEHDIFLNRANGARTQRDSFISIAFARGERQKDIAMYAGLSESTVKHIIAAQKRGVK